MKKKLMAAAAAAMLAAAGTVHAEFYDDRTSEYVEGQIENGVGYIAIYSDRKNNGDFAGMDYSIDGDKIKLSYCDNSVEMTYNSKEALFNGEKTVLNNAPYKGNAQYGEKDFTLIPMRETVEMLGGHVRYSENAYNEFVIEFGQDIKPVSGMVGDSRNKWSINVPEGFYCYSNSVDSNIVVFDNYDGIQVSVTLLQAWERFRSESKNLEDYLSRCEKREYNHGEFNYSGYGIEGHIYSNPTQEKRDMLNSIIDSFSDEFNNGAFDMSNANKDGTSWDYNNIHDGLSFDMPIRWDILMQDDKYGVFYGIKEMNSVCAGFCYPPNIRMRSYVVKDVTSKEYIENLNKIIEYYGDTNLDEYMKISEYEKSEICGRDIVKREKVKYDEDDANKFWIEIDTIFDDGTNTYILTFRASNRNGATIDAVKEELYGDINQVFSNLRTIEPKGKGVEEIRGMFPDEITYEEYEFDGYKFNIPSTLKVESEVEKDIKYTIIYNNLFDVGIFMFEHTLTPDENKDAFEYIKEGEDKGEIEKININGIDMYRDNEFIDAGMNLIILSEGKASIIYYWNGSLNTQAEKDMEAVLNSIHR